MKRRIRKKYRNIISREIFNHWNRNGIDFETTVSKIKKYRKYIQKLKSYHQMSENDYMNGYDTYGYESLESIGSNLEYISDRFCVAFRLSWLVNVPEEVNKLK